MRTVALILALLFAPLALAEAPLEIIPLRHRLADELLPVLRPLLAPGGSISAFNDKLFVRTTERNLAELRAVLDTLDVAAARLLITVRQGGESAGEDSGYGVQGRIGNDNVAIAGGSVRHSETTVRWQGSGRSEVRVGVDQGSRRSSRQTVQQVQTMDGGRARIQVGGSVPVPLRQVVVRPDGVVIGDTVVWRDLGSGFQAQPRVLGERVSIDIEPYDERPSGPMGASVGQRLRTTVDGRLGEWIALGGSTVEADRDQRSLLGRERASHSRQAAVWLKVERLD